MSATEPLALSLLAIFAMAALMPGWWFIIAGAIAGSLIGGLLDERD